MGYKKTGRDRGDGATRTSLLQQIHADFPGNRASGQWARLLAAMREVGRDPHRQARYVLVPNQGGGIDAELAALLAPAVVAGLLLAGVLR